MKKILVYLLLLLVFQANSQVFIGRSIERLRQDKDEDPYVISLEEEFIGKDTILFISKYKDFVQSYTLYLKYGKYVVITEGAFTRNSSIADYIVKSFHDKAFSEDEEKWFTSVDGIIYETYYLYDQETNSHGFISVKSNKRK